jgi:hypothetical protein
MKKEMKKKKKKKKMNMICFEKLKKHCENNFECKKMLFSIGISFYLNHIDILNYFQLVYFFPQKTNKKKNKKNLFSFFFFFFFLDNYLSFA